MVLQLTRNSSIVKLLIQDNIAHLKLFYKAKSGILKAICGILYFSRFIPEKRSVGCILLELYTGQLYFRTHEDYEHLAMIEKVCGIIMLFYFY